jgi:iron complex outermembrane recepter protein
MLGSFSKRLFPGGAGAAALCLVLGFSTWQHAAIAQTPAPAAANDLEEIIVTGSRVIADGTHSPTPLTVVTSAQLLAITPSNLADGLNKLPQFSGSQSQASIQNASTNSTGNFLDLRNLGAQRTLVLFDGDRMPPTAANGTVDVNTFPQMLIQKVEVVTGGASAVYGSDAVAGVVNFILDKHFNGLEAVAQGGISSKSDDESYKVGLAAGTDLFDKKGHVEFSFEQFDSHGIPSNLSRPLGPTMWVNTGTGTTANPLVLTPNGRQNYITFGGVVNAGPPGLLGMNFNPTTGALQPFTHGTATGSGGAESGGDGGYSDQSGLVSSLKTKQAFGRFDYEFNDNIKGHIQFSVSDAKTYMPFYDFFTFGSTVLSGNAYLPAAAQDVLTSSGADSFTIARFFNQVSGLQIQTDTTNWYVAAGLDGKITDNYSWHFNYSHSQSEQTVTNVNNINSAKFAAATDAVIDPASGGVVCHVSLTQYASLYPGCQPLAFTGPTSPTASAYVHQNTQFSLFNNMDDVSADIKGTPFSDWAGPVTFDVSGEYRKESLENISDAQPTTMADCTGLRVNCDASTPQFVSNVVGSMYATENVGEAAFETEVPLLANVTLVKALDFNGAIRETHYSTSGNATTWKLGLTWKMTDEFQIRAARSKDIRAPTLVDLYSPAIAGFTGFNDIHTGVAGDLTNYSKGNPALTPEVAKTTTAGFVYRPSWLPRFNISVDYFDIKIENVITAVDGDLVQVQAQCEQSGGTSPYCSLYNRPFPFDNRTPANFPSSISTESLNVANTVTHGVDLEANYNFDLASLFSSAPGTLAIRILGTYQPELATQTIPGTPYVDAAGVAGQNILSTGISKIRMNADLAYSIGGFDAIISERWMSSVAHNAPPIATTIPGVPAYSYTDLTLRYKMDVGKGDMQPFISIQNIFDKQPPLYGNDPSVPGLFYPVPNNYDVVGRYVTAGVRVKF